MVGSHNTDISCQNLCLFQDDANEWCFSNTSPMLSTGQEWVQYTGVDFWQVLYMPYFETQINFDS